MLTSNMTYGYTPSDWRAEMYLQALVKQEQQIRPSVHEQELLDLFGDIYDFYNKRFKLDDVDNPNQLAYFFDYLEPSENLYDCSIESIGERPMSYQQDKIKKLYKFSL